MNIKKRNDNYQQAEITNYPLFFSLSFSVSLMTIFFSVTIYRFLLLSSGIIYGYYTYVLKIDEEDFGGHGALLQEGLFASFSLFLV